MNIETITKSETTAAPEAASVFVSGVVAGTMVLTLRGECSVEDLVAGDRIITRDTGTATLRGLRSRKINVHATSVSAGSLGHNRPDCDMVLPAGQKILIRDWRAAALFASKDAMVPVARLIDGQYIRDMGEVELTVYELVFDAPHVIYAGGMEIDAPMATVSAKV